MSVQKYGTNYRNFIVGVDTRIPLGNGAMIRAINFDNAATTPPFIQVMQEINRFAPWYSSIHRGTGYKSRLSSRIYERSRKKVLDFVNADASTYTAVYVKNTTEAINKLSYRLCRKDKKCVVLSTDMEHHSNDLPWRGKYKVDYIDTDDSGRLSMDDLKLKLRKYDGRVRLVTVAGASNVTGNRNPIHMIAELAHENGAKICVDGAQLVPHAPVNMRPPDPKQCIDFLAFSGHKMYAPFGTGVLIAPKEIFEEGAPDYMGGGTVKMVTHDIIKWEDPPNKEEAGTPNLMGVVALAAAIRTLKMIGMDYIDRYERSLTEYALHGLADIPEIEIYGNKTDSRDRVGIITFNIKGMYHGITAEILSREAGIAVRNGCFCAQPYVQRLLKLSESELGEYIKDPSAPRPGMVRISFGLYNDCREIDALLHILRHIVKNKEEYIRKYEMYAKKH